jgi:hypothetical protein
MDDHVHSAIHRLANDIHELNRITNGCPRICQDVVDRIMFDADELIQAAKLMKELK